ncbi:MAG: c-type cytochrome biogenesis protein CcmI [Burkholderiales bacterium]|nr:c-type cytochrome biogenesis protein CcmI [Burkholderiales bacterium]
MMNFLIGAGLMTILLLAILMVPLLSKDKTRKTDSLPQANLDIYRDQFKELEDELARGAITQKEYDEGRTELERRVLEDSAPSIQLDNVNPKAGIYTFIMLVLLVPMAASFFWMVTQPLGDFRLDGGKWEAVADYNTGQIVKNEGEMHDLDETITKLRDRLSQDPSDLQGWMIYGRTMLTMRKYSDAATAFERALNLAPGNPQIMVDLADAVGMVQGQDLTGEPWNLLQRALKADPTNWKALMMAGTDFFNKGNYRMAVMYWERLLKTLSPNDAMTRAVKASIQEARDLGRILGPVPDTLDFGQAAAEPQQPPMMSQAMKGMNQSPVPNMSSMTTEAQQPEKVTHTISGIVEITPEMAFKIGDKDTLYITARPASGSRAPIAQQHIKVLDFPVHFQIDNTMHPPVDMGAGTLDQHERVIITARLSKEGSIMPSNGDLEGQIAEPANVGANDVVVKIDEEYHR